MEFKQVVETRRSVRKYSDRKVEREVIESILDSAIRSPSSRNSHSTEFMVVSRHEIIEQIATMRDYGSAFVKDAPLVIVVMGDRSKTDLWEVNASISATTLQYAITDAGLSSCWVHVEGRAQKQAEPQGAKADELLRQILPIPQECGVLCVVALGYSDFQPAPLPQFNATELVTYIE